MEDFLLSLFGLTIIAMAAAGFINGITPEYVTPEDFLAAEQLCENNGGLDLIDLDEIYHDVYCVNGATFNNSLRAYDAEE